MKTILIILLFLIVSPCFADDYFYIKGGVSTHSLNNDCPEFCDMGALLGHVEAGYNKQIYNTVYINLYGRHTSGINVTENGYGLNEAGIEIEKRF